MSAAVGGKVLLTKMLRGAGEEAKEGGEEARRAVREWSQQQQHAARSKETREERALQVREEGAPR